jgi:diacylglycerol kinase (ATP)
LAAQVAARLARYGAVDVRVASSPPDLTGLVASVAGRTDAVVVLGGDGSVHLAVQALAETGTPLGIVPTGTGNDAAHALGWPRDPIRAADAAGAAARSGVVREVDLGRTDRGRWWVTALYAGFDSAVNERANAMRWPRGRHRYDLAIVVEAVRLRARPFTLTMDGVSCERPATLVAVGNTPHYGGGKRMTPHARLDDGRFGVTVVGPVGRLTLARLAPTLPRAGHIGHPAVTTHVAATVSIDAPGTWAYADGERLGQLPVTTQCVSRALTVLVPAE